MIDVKGVFQPTDYIPWQTADKQNRQEDFVNQAIRAAALGRKQPLA